MESAIGDKDSTIEILEFDVTFSGLTVEDYQYLISMAKTIKAKTEAEKTLSRLRAS